MVFFGMELEDYPRTLAELEARLSGEQACRYYLFQLRWPRRFQRVRCGTAKSWPLRSGRWQCVGCGHQVSATAGTIFQDTRTPLTIWFRAMRLVTSQKNCISALGLQQVLGWGSYQTAWTSVATPCIEEKVVARSQNTASKHNSGHSMVDKSPRHYVRISSSATISQGPRSNPIWFPCSCRTAFCPSIALPSKSTL